MKFLKSREEFNQINERFETSSRRMMELVMYFEKSYEEKIELLPKFFEKHYNHVFDSFISENIEKFIDYDDYETREEAEDNVIEPTTIYELEGNYPDVYEEYVVFLSNVIDNLDNGNNPYNLDYALLPLYKSFGYEGEIENDWCVHFTDENETLDKILASKELHGIPDMDYLAISAANEDGLSPEGFCFGFDLQQIHYNFQSGYSHYGNNGVLFKTSGLQLYHNGDREFQIVFIGNTVKDMIPFWYDNNTKEFYNRDKSIITKDVNVFFELMTEQQEQSKAA